MQFFSVLSEILPKLSLERITMELRYIPLLVPVTRDQLIFENPVEDGDSEFSEFPYCPDSTIKSTLTLIGRRR